MLEVMIDMSEAEAKLRPLMQGSVVESGAVAMASYAVMVLCKRHLIRKNTTGSGRHKFWGEAAESVRSEVTGNRAKVVIPRQGMHWQRYGGTHTARPGHAISIPLRDELSGVWPSELFGPKGADPDVFVYRRPSSDKAFLGRREGAALRLYYLLVKSVSKGPDESVLPTDSEVDVSARMAVIAFVRRQLRRNNPS